jgi:cell division protein FtsB
MKDQSGTNQELSEENAFLKQKIRKLKHPEADAAFFMENYYAIFRHRR